MLGLLRSSLLVASRRASAAAAAAPRLAEAKATSLPFIPADWVFRFAPYICRDRVRFMLRFNQISFGMGLGFFYLWCHTPFECANYDHFYESPLYNYVKRELEKTGQLEENLRIKVKHFYPQES
eukprot:TRINITY_DN5950_c0_g2_i1.p3 TRINITY_DN5950_c0_g2~~TRINITY_DN5950_c0_g2_i1.p3  ORF type:complete len:124 (-),score=34.98 TRINITY_DN5950_c0_g2_i1:134-505(-)